MKNIEVSSVFVIGKIDEMGLSALEVVEGPFSKGSGTVLLPLVGILDMGFYFGETNLVRDEVFSFKE